MSIPLRIPALAMLAALALPAPAMDLMEAWEAARAHDPLGTALEARRAAGAAQRLEGESLWRPQVGLSGTAGAGAGETRMEGARFSAPGFGGSTGAAFATSVNGGTLLRWSISARQPLYSPDRTAQAMQLSLASDAAELAYVEGRQAWMLEVGARYFETVLAERQLALIERQRLAVDRALAEARDRFSLGDLPVTDTHEATARARLLEAQAVQQRNALALARLRLADITGRDAGLSVLPPLRTPALPPGREPWLARAAQDNPALRLRQSRLQSAAQEVARYRAGSDTSIDLVALAGSDRLQGSGDFGTATNLQTQGLIGISISVPLYTGGWRDAKREAAQRALEQAGAELERARREVGQLAQAAWLGVSSGEERLAALSASLVAARARLDATRLGREVGDRNTLDLLNAENDVAAAELSVLQARIDVLMARLQMDALSGQLDENRLSEINALLR